MLFCSEVETLFERETQLTIWHNQRDTVLTWSFHHHLLFKATKKKQPKKPKQTQKPNQTKRIGPCKPEVTQTTWGYWSYWVCGLNLKLIFVFLAYSLSTSALSAYLALVQNTENVDHLKNCTEITNIHYCVVYI